MTPFPSCLSTGKTVVVCFVRFKDFGWIMEEKMVCPLEREILCSGCSKTHLPGYVNDFEKFQAAGAEVIACTSTDNAFALAEWGKIHKADGKVFS